MLDDRKFEIEYYAVSDIGRVRSNHEDNVLLPSGDFVKEGEISKAKTQITYNGKFVNSSTDFKCFAVADGMGGHNAGEIASSQIVSMLKKHSSNCQTIDDFEQLVDKINFTVFELGKAERRHANLGSTLIAAVVSENKIFSVNVGDSRMYLYGKTGLKRLSHDHTEGQLLIDIGIIKDDKDCLYKMRSSLTRFIGMDKFDAEKLSCVSEGYDLSSFYFGLLCSDGISNFISDEQMEELLSKSVGSDLEEAGNNLLKKAFDVTSNEKAGSDNATLILFRPVLLDKRSNRKRGLLNRLFRSRGN